MCDSFLTGRFRVENSIFVLLPTAMAQPITQSIESKSSTLLLVKTTRHPRSITDPIPMCSEAPLLKRMIPSNDEVLAFSLSQ